MPAQPIKTNEIKLLRDRQDDEAIHHLSFLGDAIDTFYGQARDLP